MLATLALTMVVGGSDGWAVSERVVRELIPLIENDNVQIGSVAATLLESGNRELAYLVLDRSSLRGTDRRYNVFRREGKIEKIIELVSGYLPDNSKYPLPVRDALDFPSRTNVDRSLAHIQGELSAGRSLDFGVKPMEQGGSPFDPFLQFTKLLQAQEHYDEMCYAAQRSLDKSGLERLLVDLQVSYGDMVSTMVESMQPMLNALLDKVIVEHPDLLTERDLFSLAGRSRSRGLLAESTKRLLSTTTFQEPEMQDMWARAYDFRNLSLILSQLVAQRQNDLANRIFERHSAFVMSSIRTGAANMGPETAKNIALVMDGPKIDAVIKNTRTYILDAETDMLARASVFTLSGPFELLYFAKREREMLDLARLAKDRGPGAARGYIAELLKLYIDDLRYEDALRIGFELSPPDMPSVVRYLMESFRDPTKQAESKAAAELVCTYVEKHKNYEPVLNSLDLFLLHIPIERLRGLAKAGTVSALTSGETEELARASSFAALVGDEALAKTLFSRFLDNRGPEYQVVEYIQCTSIGFKDKLAWLDDAEFGKILKHFRANSWDEVIPQFLVDVLRYAQDNPTVCDRLIAEFAHTYPAAAMGDTETRAWFLQKLIYTNRVPAGPFAVEDRVAHPAFSVAMQDRILDVMRVKEGEPARLGAPGALAR